MLHKAIRCAGASDDKKDKSHLGAIYGRTFGVASLNVLLLHVPPYGQIYLGSHRWLPIKYEKNSLPQGGEAYPVFFSNNLND